MRLGGLWEEVGVWEVWEYSEEAGDEHAVLRQWAAKWQRDRKKYGLVYVVNTH